METSKKVSYFFAVILLIAFFIFLIIGLNQHGIYFNGEILFIGYMVIASGLLVSSIILFVTARFQPTKEKHIEGEDPK
jgi:hypothetical protein